MSLISPHFSRLYIDQSLAFQIHNMSCHGQLKNDTTTVLLPYFEKIILKIKMLPQGPRFWLKQWAIPCMPCSRSTHPLHLLSIHWDKRTLHFFREKSIRRRMILTQKRVRHSHPTQAIAIKVAYTFQSLWLHFSQNKTKQNQETVPMSAVLHS